MKSGKILFLSALVGVAMVDAKAKKHNDDEEVAKLPPHGYAPLQHALQPVREEEPVKKESVQDDSEKIKQQIQEAISDSFDLIEQLVGEYENNGAANDYRNTQNNVAFDKRAEPSETKKHEMVQNHERGLLQQMLRQQVDINNNLAKDLMNKKRKPIKSITFAE